jgi:hypothetical protein
LFYIVTAASFGRGLNRHLPVSPDCSRKSFFAKLGGLILAAGIVPKIFAKPASPPAAAASVPSAPLRPEPRAIARQEGSL